MQRELAAVFLAEKKELKVKNINMGKDRHDRFIKKYP